MVFACQKHFQCQCLAFPSHLTPSHLLMSARCSAQCLPVGSLHAASCRRMLQVRTKAKSQTLLFKYSCTKYLPDGSGWSLQHGLKPVILPPSFVCETTTNQSERRMEGQETGQHNATAQKLEFRTLRHQVRVLEVWIVLHQIYFKIKIKACFRESQVSHLPHTGIFVW